MFGSDYLLIFVRNVRNEFGNLGNSFILYFSVWIFFQNHDKYRQDLSVVIVKHTRNILAESSNNLNTGDHLLNLIIFNTLKIINAQTLALHFTVVFIFKLLTRCDSLSDIVCDGFQQTWQYFGDDRAELLFVEGA